MDKLIALEAIRIELLEVDLELTQMESSLKA